MKVLFISSGNKGVTHIVTAQAKSLQLAGVEVGIWPVIGKGLVGYLRAVPALHKYVRRTRPDIIHAHYSLCGITAALATCKPAVVSLMGSDVHTKGPLLILLKLFIRWIWTATIVKSEQMKAALEIGKVAVIPNGVDISIFKPLDRELCLQKLNWDSSKKHVLFVAAMVKQRPEKNLVLAQEAVASCQNPEIELHVVSNVSHADMPCYLNAADVLMLTSKWEGSPNIVKEAMACNRPVVSTEVGDIKWLFGNESGYYVTAHNAEDIRDKLLLCLNAKNEIKGRDRLISLGLDSVKVAANLVQIYKSIVNARS